MIRVPKGDCPKVLNERAAGKQQDLIDLYDNNSADYNSGKEMIFNAKLYGHGQVKKKLESDHNGKCCYCEVKIPTPYASTHVEHFRPKAFSTQERQGDRIYPGYFWLAYEWSNLYLSCQVCNSTYKGNIFPLNDPSKRARSSAEIPNEEPALLDPSGSEDPRNHIRFHDEVVIGLSTSGLLTISTMGLDAGARDESRRERLTQLRLYIAIIERLGHDPHPKSVEMVANARIALNQAPASNAPFSSMAIDFLAKNPPPA